MSGRNQRPWRCQEWNWEPPGWCPEDWRLAYQRWRLPGEMEGVHQFLPVYRLCQDLWPHPK
ncbi:MAG: hypothetical protein OWU33_14640 [Firmicutes bacterium]|nr:hypothetical protein [Bacillota bacterium]